MMFASALKIHSAEYRYLPVFAFVIFCWERVVVMVVVVVVYVAVVVAFGVVVAVGVVVSFCLGGAVKQL